MRLRGLWLWALGILFLPACLWSAEDYSTWKYSAKLRLNTTATGANVSRSITGFPLLVRITDSRILSQSMATGADVRFADEKGAHLDFQVERWNAAAKKAEFWVRVPQVDSLSDKQYLTVFWGKANSEWLSDGSKVFTAAVGYSAVYHLGEGGTQTRANSVGSNNHGTARNYDGDERVEGVIGMADSLDGATAGDYLDLGAGFENLNFGFTFTVWAYCARAGYYERFLDLGNNSNQDNILLAREKSANDIAAYVWNGGVVALHLGKTGALDERKWMQLAFTITGNEFGGSAKNTATLYKNGIKIAEGALSQPIPAVLRTNNSLGRSNWTGNAFFTGILDEAQISVQTQNAEWIKLSYESQRPDPKMFAWEFPAAVKLAISTGPLAQTVAEGKPAKLSITAVSSGAIFYQWFKDGASLAGATGAELNIAAVTLANAGLYACRVTDGLDSLTSSPALLTVPEDLPTWAHSQKIFINTTATGANLSGDVANIPILVRLGKQALDFKQVGEGGKDLRFAHKDGTPYAHYIERWGTDTAEVWVRVPMVGANTNDYGMMYWGKAAAKQASSSLNVFHLNDGWRLYYDFADAPSGGGDTYAKDATLNAARGGGIGITSVAECVIGKCFSFAGNSHIESPQSAIEGLKTYTVMAWVREKTIGHAPGDIENPHLFGTRLAVAQQGEFGAYSKDGGLHFWNGMHSVPPFTVHPTAVKLVDKAWHLIAITYTGSSMTLYADGDGVLSSPGDNLALGPNVLSIGALRSAQGVWAGGFTGEIDAVQMTGDAKGKDWMRLAYETQRPGADIISFGAAADLPPPAPAINPPGGSYVGALQIQITCASDSARIFYTLDGSDPDTVARGSTKAFNSGLIIATGATVKAKAYSKGKSSPTATATYAISAIIPVSIGDTLRPGATKEIDPTHRVTYPNQDSKSPVRLTAGPAWNPLPKGFDRVGPLFILAAVDTSAAFPGLSLDGDSLDGLSLFRREPSQAILWMPPKDGQLWIPAPGAYFWGRDTLPPTIRYLGSETQADTQMARIVIDDNVAGVQGKVSYWNGGQDSLGWWSAAAGEILEFPVPAPAKPETPLEVRFTANDRSRISTYPAIRNLTLPRPLSAFAAPFDLKAGIRWKMAGLPLIADGSVTLSDLAAKSGSGPLYAAIWRSVPGPDSGYLILKDKDTLPAGKGFWLAAEHSAPIVILPASRSLASDSDGLFTLRLQKGWNLVTCPSFRPLAWPVSTKDGDAYLRSALKPLHGMADSGYSRPDSLRPWEAYYVWYDKDTTVRIGPGAPRVTDFFKAPKSSSPAKSLRLNLSGPGAQLDLGASTFARSGFGREDESRPPPMDRGASAWLAREGRALAADYVAWDPEHAMAWTVASRGQAADASLAITEAALPPGFEAWAVSPSRNLKWRLLPGSNIPVTGDDTLSVYAGTPRALAKIGDLQRGRAAAGAFAARLRATAGGLELILELPGNATLALSIYDASGHRLGGLVSRELAPGRHAFTWQSLALGQSHLPQGAYFMSLHAQGPDWTRRQVQSVTLIH